MSAAVTGILRGLQGTRSRDDLPSPFTNVYRALRRMARSWREVSILLAVVYVPAEAALQIAALLAGTTTRAELTLVVLRALVYAAAGALIAPALVYTLDESNGEGGRCPGTVGALRLGGARFVRSLLARIQASALVCAGTVLFVAPGLLLMVMGSLVDPVVALEPDERKAWSRSRRLTAGMRSNIIASGAIMIVLDVAIISIGYAALRAVAGGTSGMSAGGDAQQATAALSPAWARLLASPPAVIFRALLFQFIGTTFTALSYEMYRVARVAKQTGGSRRRGRAGK